MSFRTLSSFNIKPTWPASWPTTGAKLVVVLDRDVVASDGVQYQGANEFGEGVGLSSLGFYFSSAITVTDGAGSAASIANLPTTDTSQPLHTAKYYVFIYTGNTLREVLTPAGFHLHESVNGDSATFSWQQWVVAQAFKQGSSQLPMIGDRATMQAMVDAANLASGVAGVGTLGRVETRTAPLDPLRPIVIDKDDPWFRDATKLQGRAVASTAPTAGQALVYDGTQWEPGAASSFVSVAAFATGGAGTLASPFTGWDTAIVWASNTTYDFGSFHYSYTLAWVLLNKSNLRLIASGPGGAVLHFNGAGVALTLESTALGGHYGGGVENIEIVGNASATTGLLTKGMHHQRIVNVVVRDVTDKAFYFRWAILGYYETLRCSINEGDWTLPGPTHGFYTDQLGVGQTFQGNSCFNIIMEGTTGTGIVLNDAWNNVFTGSSEGNQGGGISITANSKGNKIESMDFEANAGDDVNIAGPGNILSNVLSTGQVEIAGGQGNVIRDGMMHEIVIGAGASNTILDNASFALNGGGGVSDSSATTIQLTPLRNINTGSTGFIFKTPSLVAPWVNFGGSHQTAGYSRQGAEIVLRGSVKSGADGTAVFTLPVGARPTATRQFYTQAGAGAAFVYAQADGQVIVNLQAGGTTAIVPLDGIRFDVQ